MSSDYLDYKLSKELHDLGVVLEDGDAVFLDGNITRPSTAQLIDELQRREATSILMCFYEGLVVSQESEYTWELDEIGHDRCCTTALGKALITLVKQKEE